MPRREHTYTGLEAFVYIIVVVVLGFLLAMFEAWMIMLLLEALHHATGWSCNLGYDATLILVVIFNLFTAGWRAHK